MSNKKIIFSVFLLMFSLMYISCAAVNSAQGSRIADEENKTIGEKAEVSTKDTAFQKDGKNLKQPKLAPSPVRKTVFDNSVCAEPNLPCNHKQKAFDEWELSFRMPSKILPNKTYKSAPFYAVILKKYDDGCDDFDSNPKIEPERQRIQKLFSSRKVFAEYSCPNMDAVNYSFEGKFDAANEMSLYMDYIAVYAGVTEEEGEEIYELLAKDYPQAELKKMTAEYTRLEE